MSPTEEFYYAVCKKMNITRSWGELHPIEQMQFVQAINMILNVVQNEQRF